LANEDGGNQPDPPGDRQKPNWIARCVSEFKRYRDKRRAEKYHESATDKASRSTSRATWAIAVFTLATIGVGISQYVIFSRQLNEMRATREGGDAAFAAQLAVMRDQTKVMQGQLDQMGVAQRPWLRIENVRPIGLDIHDPFVGITLDLEITNVGHQPAENADVKYKVYRTLFTTEEHGAALAVCREGAAQPRTDLSEVIFPGENRAADEYAFVTTIADIKADRDKRTRERTESEETYPLRSTFLIVGCVSYTYRNGTSLGQTAFILDVVRPCEISPVGKCSFDIIDRNSYGPNDMLVTEERRGVFAR
jgi:hypothetical protein